MCSLSLTHNPVVRLNVWTMVPTRWWPVMTLRCSSCYLQKRMCWLIQPLFVNRHLKGMFYSLFDDHCGSNDTFSWLFLDISTIFYGVDQLYKGRHCCWRFPFRASIPTTGKLVIISRWVKYFLILKGHCNVKQLVGHLQIMQKFST